MPLSNQRYVLNAANARWGNRYDALYGTDAIGETDGAARTAKFNPARGVRVVAFARKFLDAAAPLENGSHKDAASYRVENGRLVVTLESGTTALQDLAQFIAIRAMPLRRPPYC